MLKLDIWNIVWTIVNILVLYAIFRKFLFQPVLKVIQDRENIIKDQIDTIDEIFCDVDESCEIPFRECSYMKEDIADTAELFTEEVEVEPEEIVDNIILTKDDDDSAENAVTNK